MRAACSRDVQPVMVDCKSAFFVDMKETGFRVWTSVKLQAESVNMTDSFHEEVLCVQKKKKKKNAAVYTGPLCVWAVSMGTVGDMCLAV